MWQLTLTTTTKTQHRLQVEGMKGAAMKMMRWLYAISKDLIEETRFFVNPNKDDLQAHFIRSAKQDDIYWASNIVLPCPGS